MHGGNHDTRNLLQPTGIFVDPSHNEVYVSDGEGGNHGGQFNVPHSIATDSKGNVYVGKTLEGKRIQRFLFKCVK